MLTATYVFYQTTWFPITLNDYEDHCSF